MSIYLVESMQTDTSTHIYEFHRNSDGTSDTKVVKTFKPYFFVDVDAPIDKLDGVVSVEKGYTSIEETPVKKVSVQKSTMVKPLREKVEELGYKHWEADILLHNRYCIDMDKEIEETKLSVCFLDIETNYVGVSPDMETADQEIVCLTAKFDEELVVWLWGTNKVKDTRFFNTEEEMLNDFMDYFFKK